MPRRRPDIPDAWPALMALPLAAAYCGFASEQTFRREVKAKRLPAPVAISPQLMAWRIEDLDAWRRSLEPLDVAAARSAPEALRRELETWAP